MARYLILYDTMEGQAAKIAEYIANVLIAHATPLAQMPTVFFSVSLTEAYPTADDRAALRIERSENRRLLCLHEHDACSIARHQ